MNRLRTLLTGLVVVALSCSDDGAPPPEPPAIPEGSMVTYTEEREPCDDRNPQRNLYWGDLHVHTALSFDAWTFDVRNEPDDAYAFARGEELLLPPLDTNGVGTQRIALDRPLDFAAVTDHSEYLAEVEGCRTPGSAVYDAQTCIDYRQADTAAITLFGARMSFPEPTRLTGICSEAYDCVAEAAPIWQRVVDAAEAAYDRSSTCGFTTFAAYEWSGHTNYANLHRNVIFRNDDVPSNVASYFDYPTPELLWDRLLTDCRDREGRCDVLAIPHNSNWSNGAMFAVENTGDLAADRVYAEKRATLEPLFEVFQHKGDSECTVGLASQLGAPDELCAFEKLRPDAEDCGDTVGGGGVAGFGCTSRYDFIRGALKRGLAEEQRLGVNPFELGIIASTDTHNGTPGAVAEDAYLGHWGDNEDVAERRLSAEILPPRGIVYNPGGLAAVWAVENSRDALFEAMQRRETYGTSGPRIAVRFFGGSRLDSDLCDRPDLVERAYEQGVPMGGRLESSTDPPTFVAWATRDLGTPDSPGNQLSRVQIIKGWIDSGGVEQEKVIDVAGGDTGADVDPATCGPRGDGFDELCSTWTDPEFDPAQPAFYYVRVVENPSCRWSTRQCLALPAAERPEACDSDAVRAVVQERAWTSPIFYRPSD